MPRPKSPHGTYAAYKRHLTENTPVCGPCRQAQSDHDAVRPTRFQHRAAPAPTSAINPRPGAQLESEQDSGWRQYANWSEAREMFRKGTIDLLSMAHDDYLYGVTDLMDEMNDLLEQWVAGHEDEHGPLTPS